MKELSATEISYVSGGNTTSTIENEFNFLDYIDFPFLVKSTIVSLVSGLTIGTFLGIPIRVAGIMATTMIGTSLCFDALDAAEDYFFHKE